MIRLTERGTKEIALYFEALPKRVHSSIQRALLRAVIGLQRYVILNKLEGQALRHRTGNLQRNIVYDVTEGNGRITGYVGVAVGAPYGKLHELGGVVDVRSHLRTSRRGKEFTVRGYKATYPVRAFLGPSLDENEDKIDGDLKEAVQKAL